MVAPIFIAMCCDVMLLIKAAGLTLLAFGIYSARTATSVTGRYTHAYNKECTELCVYSNVGILKLGLASRH